MDATCDNECIMLCLMRVLAWCMRLPQVQASEMTGVCERTVQDWYAFCRSTCSKGILKADFRVICSLCNRMSMRNGCDDELRTPAGEEWFDSGIRHQPGGSAAPTEPTDLTSSTKHVFPSRFINLEATRPNFHVCTL
ncbi:Hypothetical protein PHPALM_3224 [Phytophthora palmivora]|uniref:Uncharacterized protein n=1 Tax=Phytophthora palmivora TaxID=4796 RepID=A0A2P4YMW6_9STRA|nr:Hypothetical protein PHPALM_3224 [Phytophthora palmivora]